MKKKIKKELIFSLVIAFLMVLSVFGFVLNYTSTSQKIRYNSYSFVLTQKGWLTKLDKKNLFFPYNPKEVEKYIKELNITNSSLNLLLGKKQIYITSNFNSSLASTISSSVLFLEKNLKLKNIFIKNSFTSPTPYNTKVITCDNATSFVPVIFIKKAEKTSLQNFENCLIVNVRTAEELKIITTFITYKLLGIM